MVKKDILTNKLSAPNQFAGQNTQQVAGNHSSKEKIQI